MIAARIEGSTRVFGRGQPEYKELHVRDERKSDGAPVMATAWEPTPDELELLRRGAKVEVRIAGTRWPPILVEVGAAP